jgi:predicted nucleic acid-binding protein
MKTAVDSNVLSALWSTEASSPRVWQELRNARSLGAITICAPVYVELCAHPIAERSLIDKFLAETSIAIDFCLDEEVWRKAAEGFGAYAARRRKSKGDSPKRLLPDFLIAAHALLRADRLFTLDPSRYRRDFPDLQLL